jgi:hypothetical protein
VVVASLVEGTGAWVSICWTCVVMGCFWTGSFTSLEGAVGGVVGSATGSLKEVDSLPSSPQRRVPLAMPRRASSSEIK